MKPLINQKFTNISTNLIEEIRKYNSFINKNLNEIEKNFKDNKIKEEELIKEVHDKQKIIEDLENQINSKNKELLNQKK